MHEAAAGGVSPALLQATDSAIDRLVQMLMSVGRQHDLRTLPEGAHGVLDALDQLLAASAELLRDARSGLEREGVAALAALAPRIAALRELEGGFERAAGRLRDGLAEAQSDAVPDDRSP